MDWSVQYTNRKHEGDMLIIFVIFAAALLQNAWHRHVFLENQSNHFYPKINYIQHHVFKYLNIRIVQLLLKCCISFSTLPYFLNHLNFSLNFVNKPGFLNTLCLLLALFSVLIDHERKVIPSVCNLFSPVICQFWLTQLRIFQDRKFRSKCSSGHLENKFKNTRWIFFARFFLRSFANSMLLSSLR